MTSAQTYQIISNMRNELRQLTKTEPAVSILFTKIETLDELKQRLKRADEKWLAKIESQAKSIEEEVRK